MFMNMGVPDGILIHGKDPHTDCILPLFQEFYLQCKIMNNSTQLIIFILNILASIIPPIAICMHN